MHDSGGNMHVLPSYEKGSDQQAESRPNVNAGIADPYIKTNLFMEGEMCSGMENPANLKLISHRRAITFVLLKTSHLVNAVNVENMLFGSEISWFIRLLSKVTLDSSLF